MKGHEGAGMTKPIFRRREAREGGGAQKSEGNHRDTEARKEPTDYMDDTGVGRGTTKHTKNTKEGEPQKAQKAQKEESGEPRMDTDEHGLGRGGAWREARGWGYPCPSEVHPWFKKNPGWRRGWA